MGAGTAEREKTGGSRLPPAGETESVRKDADKD